MCSKFMRWRISFSETGLHFSGICANRLLEAAVSSPGTIALGATRASSLLIALPRPGAIRARCVVMDMAGTVQGRFDRCPSRQRDAARPLLFDQAIVGGSSGRDLRAARADPAQVAWQRRTRRHHLRRIGRAAHGQQDGHQSDVGFARYRHVLGCRASLTKL